MTTVMLAAAVAWVRRSFSLGSGDQDPDEGPNRAFRQTGLHDNNGRFRGVDRFRYYGELLRPELSNLEIQQVALGVPLFRSSSLEVIYQRYRQVYAAPYLRESRLQTEPDGFHTDIGSEWDVVLGIEEWKHLETEVVGSMFRAGRAYGAREGERAFLLILKVDVNF